MSQHNQHPAHRGESRRSQSRRNFWWSSAEEVGLNKEGLDEAHGCCRARVEGSRAQPGQPLMSARGWAVLSGAALRVGRGLHAAGSSHTSACRQCRMIFYCYYFFFSQRNFIQKLFEIAFLKLFIYLFYLVEATFPLDTPHLVNAKN